MMFTMHFIYSIKKGLRNNFLAKEFPCYTISHLLQLQHLDLFMSNLF